MTPGRLDFNTPFLKDLLPLVGVIRDEEKDKVSEKDLLMTLPECESDECKSTGKLNLRIRIKVESAYLAPLQYVTKIGTI